MAATSRFDKLADIADCRPFCLTGHAAGERASMINLGWAMRTREWAYRSAIKVGNSLRDWKRNFWIVSATWFFSLTWQYVFSDERQDLFSKIAEATGWYSSLRAFADTYSGQALLVIFLSAANLFAVYMIVQRSRLAETASKKEIDKSLKFVHFSASYIATDQLIGHGSHLLDRVSSFTKEIRKVLEKLDNFPDLTSWDLRDDLDVNKYFYCAISDLKTISFIVNRSFEEEKFKKMDPVLEIKDPGLGCKFDRSKNIDFLDSIRWNIERLEEARNDGELGLMSLRNQQLSKISDMQYALSANHS